MIRITSSSSPDTAVVTAWATRIQPRENRTEQLVALFSLYIAVLNGNRRGIIERKTGESEVDAVFGD